MLELYGEEVSLSIYHSGRPDEGVLHEFKSAHSPLPDSSSPEEEVRAMGHLQNSIHIDAPVDKVRGFTDDPHNWATFMVGMSEPDKIFGYRGVGTQVEFTFLMAGVRIHETSQVVEDRRYPYGGGHGRLDFTGPSCGWQTWDFKPTNGGTLVTTEMEYTVPGSVLVKVTGRLIVEKMQERNMRHSLENLKLLMEGSPS